MEICICHWGGDIFFLKFLSQHWGGEMILYPSKTYSRPGGGGGANRNFPASKSSFSLSCGTRDRGGGGAVKEFRLLGGRNFSLSATFHHYWGGKRILSPPLHLHWGGDRPLRPPGISIPGQNVQSAITILMPNLSRFKWFKGPTSTVITALGIMSDSFDSASMWFSPSLF